MRKSKLIYLNPICYMDTDLSVLKYLNAHYELIWYPIYYTKETKYSQILLVESSTKVIQKS